MLKQNLKYLRKKNKISQQSLSEVLGVPRTTLGDYERGKTEPNIDRIVALARYFKVNIDDLLTKNISHYDLEIIRNKDLRVLAISVDPQNKNNIELIGRKAEAGYLENFHNPEYIAELPKISIPNLENESYRGFEISGDSMLPVESGSIIICSYLESLSDIKDGKTYVVVSQNEGLVYKRIRNDERNQRLILESDNTSYLPYYIDYVDIDEIWAYKAHISFSDGKLSFNHILEEKLEGIQRQLNLLKDQKIIYPQN